MRISTFSAIVGACVVSLLAFPAAFGSENDWPQWRGPHQTGISTETGLLDTWNDGPPKELWRVPLGLGYSALSVAGGKIYTLYGEADNEWVVCLDTATGDEIWKERSGDQYVDKTGFGDGPRSTPTVDNGKVYTLGGNGYLQCLDAVSGNRIWGFSTAEEFGATTPTWGHSGSPVVDGDKLIVIVGGTDNQGVIALNKNTGEKIWASLSDAASYCTPLLIEVDGMEQAVCFMAKAIVGVARDDGKELWRYPWVNKHKVNAATPIFHNNKLFLASGYGCGSALLALSVEAGVAKAEEIWKTKDMESLFSSSVLIDGYLYGSHLKRMQCVEFDTGDVKWTHSGFSHGTVLPVDGKAIILGEKSKLALAKLSPEGFEEISRADHVISGKTWTIPTIVDGKMYIRNQSEIVCLDMKTRSSPII